MLSHVFRHSSRRDVVKELQAIDRESNRPIRSGNTRPYSKTHQRLDLNTVKSRHDELNGRMKQVTSGFERERLLRVDATIVRLDDTVANRDA